MAFRVGKTTLVKTNSGMGEFSIEGKLASDRILFLEGSICSEMAMGFAKEVMDLTEKNKKKPIKVVINSQGGEIASGQMIIDIISGSKTPIELYCFEKAFSMAAVIFISGKHGRYMLPNARLMIHEPSITNISGSSSDIKNLSEFIEKSKKKLYSAIVSHSNFTLEELEEQTKEDLYLSADECIKKALAEKVVSFADIVADC